MRKQIAIAAIVGVAVTAAYFAAILRPKLNEIEVAQRRTVEAREQEQTLRMRLAQLEQARHNAPQTTARLKRLRTLLPPTPSIPVFIRQLQKAATVSKVDLRTIQPALPAAIERASGVRTITVNIMVIGTYKRIHDFLVRVERLERVAEVTGISLAPAAEAPRGTPALNGTFGLRLYEVRKDARVGAATAGAASTRPAGGN